MPHYELHVFPLANCLVGSRDHPRAPSTRPAGATHQSDARCCSSSLSCKGIDDDERPERRARKRFEKQRGAAPRLAVLRDLQRVQAPAGETLPLLQLLRRADGPSLHLGGHLRRQEKLSKLRSLRPDHHRSQRLRLRHMPSCRRSSFVALPGASAGTLDGCRAVSRRCRGGSLHLRHVVVPGLPLLLSHLPHCHRTNNERGASTPLAWEGKRVQSRLLAELCECVDRGRRRIALASHFHTILPKALIE